jgi:hypothetical protein
MIFPDNKKIKLTLNKKYGWRLGGEFSSTIDSVENFLGIYRLREKHLLNGKEKIKLAHNNIKNINTYEINKATAQKIRQNIIFLRAIDSKNGRKIQLEDIRKYKAQGLIGKNTSRNMAYLLFETNVDISTQKKLISHFNEELTQNRKKYLSLFLTNFRDNNRKRIGFDFAYKLINHIYANKLSTNPKIC